MSEATTDDQTTTIALIAQKLDRLLLDVAEVRSEFKQFEQRQREDEETLVRLQEQVRVGDRDSKIVAAITGFAASVIGRVP